MTEEMIDGVDVSGCIYKKYGIADCGMLACGGYKCEGQICLYKQLKRLEQENAKLKEVLKSVRGYFIVLENIIPTKMLAEGSGVFGAINDAKKEIDEVLKDE